MSTTHKSCNLFHVEFCLNCLLLLAGGWYFWLARQVASNVLPFKTVAKLELGPLFAVKKLCRSGVQETLKGDRCAQGDRSDLEA